MWCSKCKDITVCEAIPTTYLGKKVGHRWFKTDHPDINWFRRGRRCQTCGHNFLTAEIGEKLLTELCELRDALSDVRKNAKTYSTESRKASKSLRKLAASLKVLKALNLT